MDIKRSYAWITACCKEEHGADPIRLAKRIMADQSIRMHGPEHHFLTAAVLMTACCNATGKPLGNALDQLCIRTDKILPAVCGYYGVCGDVLAAGAFMSVWLGNHYMAGETWRINGQFAAVCQRMVYQTRGPRCCKRTTFAAIEGAAAFLAENEMITLSMPRQIKCGFFKMNDVCLKDECPYYPKKVR